jgi:hypothetical protein
MSDLASQAANDAQASTGSHDDDSTTSSTSQPNKTTRFYKRLSAWLTLYDQKAYLKDKVESLQAAGPAANEPDFTNAVTERKTVDINELRAYTALQDWLQDNDPEGTFLALHDAAVETFGPLLDERTRLILEVVRTLRELNDTATNSSGAPDPTYNARAAAHQQAKNEMSTNDAEHWNRIALSPGHLLRRTQQQQQQRAVLRYSRNQRRPPLPAVAEDQHPL